MRPTTLDEVVGQSHLLGPKGALTRLTAGGRLPSMVMWGPPGTGKTTLARILAEATGHGFMEFSGASGSAAELKKFLADSREMPCSAKCPPWCSGRDPPFQSGPAGHPAALPGAGRGHPHRRHHGEPGLLPECGATQPLSAHRLKSLEPVQIRQVLKRAWAKERGAEPEPVEVFEWLSNWLAATCGRRSRDWRPGWRCPTRISIPFRAPWVAA